MSKLDRRTFFLQAIAVGSALTSAGARAPNRR